MNWFITGDTHRNFDKIEEYINELFPKKKLFDLNKKRGKQWKNLRLEKR